MLYGASMQASYRAEHRRSSITADRSLENSGAQVRRAGDFHVQVQAVYVFGRVEEALHNFGEDGPRTLAQHMAFSFEPPRVLRGSPRA